MSFSVHLISLNLKNWSLNVENNSTCCFIWAWKLMYDCKFLPLWSRQPKKSVLWFLVKMAELLFGYHTVPHEPNYLSCQQWSIFILLSPAKWKVSSLQVTIPRGIVSMSRGQIREIASFLWNYKFFHTKRNSEKSNFRREMRCLNL